MRRMLAGIVVLIVAAVAVLLLSACGGGSQSGSIPTGGPVQFADSLPASSPDGKFVAFVRGKALEVLTLKTGRVGRLTPVTWRREVHSPAWSPDSRSIVFSGFGTGLAAGGKLYRVDVQSGRLMRFSRPQSSSDLGPAWSPDGSHIAFARLNSLWVTRADGTAQSALFTRAYVAGFGWSPDGKRLALTSGAGLSVIDRDGRNLRRLLPGSSLDDATWSPDGKSVLFTDHGVLKVISATGGAPQVLVHPGGDIWCVYPAWSPDGRLIAFAEENTGGSDNLAGDAFVGLYTVRFDGSGLKLIAGPIEHEQELGYEPYLRPFSWLGNGRIILGGDGGAPAPLVIMDENGKHQQRLTQRQ